MKDNFAACLAHILKFEGGKSDDPRDPGGRTKQGITFRTYQTYRSAKGLPSADVYSMSSAERDEIYRRAYWNKIGGDTAPDGMDLCLFDLAVNSGPDRARAMSQRPSSGLVSTDIKLLCAERLAFMKTLRAWPTFGDGWEKRVNEVQRLALSMASGKPLKKPIPPVVPAGGAVVAGGAIAVGAAPHIGAVAAIGIAIVAAAIALDLMLQKRPSGTAKAQAPGAVVITAPSLTPGLDVALADLKVKKAAYDAALDVVATERNKVLNKVDALRAAVTAADGKLSSLGAGIPSVPLEAPMQPPEGPRRPFIVTRPLDPSEA